jgi:hypothetical protein
MPSWFASAWTFALARGVDGRLRRVVVLEFDRGKLQHAIQALARDEDRVPAAGRVRG